MKKTGSLAKALSKYKDMNASVRVGVLEDATYPNGESVAMVAFWNEYGEGVIPPRPFFRQTVFNQKSNWVSSTTNLMKIHNDPEKVMGLMGEHMKGQIVQSINTWTDPPNSEYTVKKKGFNAPLRETGLLGRTISYEVNKDES